MKEIWEPMGLYAPVVVFANITSSDMVGWDPLAPQPEYPVVDCHQDESPVAWVRTPIAKNFHEWLDRLVLGQGYYYWW